MAPPAPAFGTLLRRYRAAAGLAQEDLAARASLSVDAINALEGGGRRRPRRETVTLLAEALDLVDDNRIALEAARHRVELPPAQPADPTTTVALEPHPVAAAPPGAYLPTGTVTFLFTDIEGSTRLLNQLGGSRCTVFTCTCSASTISAKVRFC